MSNEPDRKTERVAAIIALAMAGAILLLGACTADRKGDDWEYRKDPSDNYGRILRPAPDR